jgi:hypothetical protein
LGELLLRRIPLAMGTGWNGRSGKGSGHGRNGRAGGARGGRRRLPKKLGRDGERLPLHFV